MISVSKRSLVSIALATALLAPSILLVTETGALAQPAKKKTLREQLPEEAKKHWDTAVALYQRGLWDGARTSFNAAFDASRNPRVLFNVAVCEKNLGHFGRAIEIFKKELADGIGQLSADEEADVRTQISGLELFVAQITIDVSEAGADIYIDDAKAGVSPLPGPISVPVGERHIRVSKAGFAEAHETVDLKAGASGKVGIKLSAMQKTSLVNISVIGPASAIVKIDGREVGTAPYKGLVNVSAEPHSFSAEASEFVTATQSAMVREGEVLNLTLQLSQEQSKGKLLVLAHPEGSTIEIDGKVVGSSRWEGPVDVGTHQIVVRKRGHYTWSYDVAVSKGAKQSVTAALNEDRNTNFVPWLIGTVLVLGTSATAVYFIARPKDGDPVKGTLPPFTVGTSGVRF